MPATFVIGGTTATFNAVMRGSSQEAGDLERVTVGVSVADAAAWTTLESLLTSKYHMHLPLDASVDPVIDVVRGAGAGTLTVTGLGAATAVLTALSRNTYPRGAASRTVGTAQFLRTGAWA